MSKFGILFKNELRQAFASYRGGRKNRAAAGFVGAGVLLFALLLIFESVTLTFSQITLGNETSGTTSMIGMGIIFMLMMAFMRASNAHGAGRDAELLLPLPVKRVTIILAKYACDYITDAAVLLLLLMPSAIVYTVLSQAGMGCVLRGLLLCAVYPLLSLGCGRLLSLGLSALQGRTKNSRIFSSIFSLLLFLVFFAAIMMTSNAQLATAGSGLIEKAFGFAIAFFFAGGWLPLAENLALCILPAALGTALYARAFGKPQRVYRAAKRQELVVKADSIVRSLWRKELRDFFGCTPYLMNIGFGYLLLPIGCAALLFFSDALVALGNYNTAVGFAAFAFLLGMGCMTAVSISLEGKNLWILKAHPVAVRDIFKAKVYAQLTVAAAVSLPSTILAGIGLRLSISAVVLLFVCALLLSLVYALVGLILNLHFPRLSWDNPIVLFKQSMPVMIMVFGAMGLTVVCGALFLPFAGLDPLFSQLCYLGVLFVMLALAAALCALYLKKRGEALFLRLGE